MPYKRRGHAARPLTESEIKGAQLLSKTATEAAERLNVSYATYKKWARRYGLHEKFTNVGGKGVSKKLKNPDKGKYPLNDILKGMYPDFPTFRLKKRLINCKYKKEECEVCGFDEKRVTDGKTPIILDYIDGNPKNKKLENLRFLCYNCAFLHRGYISRGKDEMYNPDNLQKEPYYNKPVKKVDVDESEDDEELNFDDLSEEEIEQLMGGD